MEYKGSTRLDFDSEENESTSASHEKMRPIEPIVPPQPERTLFGGVLFNRQEDRERSTTEVAREVIPGFSEPEQILPPIQFRPEQFGQAPIAPELATEEDDDEDESDQKNSSSGQISNNTVIAEEAPRPRRYNVEPVLPPSIVEFAAPTDEDSSRPAAGGVPPLPNPEFTEPQPALPPDELLTRRTSMEVDRTSPDQDQMEVMTDAKMSQPPDEFTPPPAAGNSGGMSPPPPTKPPVPSRGGGPSSSGWGGGNVSAAYAQPSHHNTYHPAASMLSLAANQFVSRRSVENVRQEYRRKMAAQAILFLALGWYLGHRPVKKLRKEVGGLQETSKQQQAELTNLNYQHQEAQARIAEQNRQIEQFTRPEAVRPQPVIAPVPFQTEQAPVVTTRQPQAVEISHQQAVQPEQQTRVIGENGQQIVLQGDQRVELAGAYSAVFNNRNEVVQNAIQYGDEYKRDQMPERTSAASGSQNAQYAQNNGYGAAATGGFAPMAGAGSSSGAPGGYTSQYGLPMNDAGQTPNQEAQYLLPPPKPNPIVSAITSPWLWLGVGILLLAFFAAATI